MVELRTIGGWLLLLGAGYLYYHVKIRGGKRTKMPQKALEAQKKARGNSIGEKSNKLAEKAPAKKKAKKPVAPESEPAWLTNAADSDNGQNDEISNREFARQLSEKKSGMLLPGKTQTGTSRQKSVKQSKALEKPVIHTPDSTAPSSAAGDADDDQSSAINSPELGATDNDTPVVNGGISDMLEAPTPGPSVLRVIAPTNQTEPKKSKAPAPFEAAETKKQRQNRKKAQEKKEVREAEEQERKKLAEKQRRTAREAEGRAAKDGSSFMALQAATPSAWENKSKGVGASKPAEAAKVELLDTYDKHSKAVEQSEDDNSAKQNWDRIALELGSEEEQKEKFAMTDDSMWETAGSKKNKKKKAKTVTQEDVDKIVEKEQLKESDHQYLADNKSPTPQKSEEQIKAAGQKYEYTLQHFESGGKTEPYTQEVQDSEWEV
jgi:hypothetical protein